jgi:hypothetical protein
MNRIEINNLDAAEFTWRGKVIKPIRYYVNSDGEEWVEFLEIYPLTGKYKDRLVIKRDLPPLLQLPAPQ